MKRMKGYGMIEFLIIISVFIMFIIVATNFNKKSDKEVGILQGNEYSNGVCRLPVNSPDIILGTPIPMDIGSGVCASGWLRIHFKSSGGITFTCGDGSVITVGEDNESME